MIVDRQTHTQTDRHRQTDRHAHHNSPLPYRGRSNYYWGQWSQSNWRKLRNWRWAGVMHLLPGVGWWIETGQCPVTGCTRRGNDDLMQLFCKCVLFTRNSRSRQSSSMLGPMWTRASVPHCATHSRKTSAPYSGFLVLSWHYTQPQR